MAATWIAASANEIMQVRVSDNAVRVCRNETA
jgi:hypothetical protein